MKTQFLIFSSSLLLAIGNIFGQSNQTNKLSFWFLDKESESNITVAISDLGGRGQPCPPKYTNALSNTNLFTPEEQKLIKEVFVKYRNVTTNSGPPGSVLANLYRTNFVIKAMNETVKDENWVADFQYTNSDMHERIRFGFGMIAESRNKSNDGCDVSLTRMGGGTTLFGFMEIKHNLPNGLAVRFYDNRSQGMSWDYKLASLTNSSLVEYRQYTNGLVLGKYLMWNPANGNLTIEAEFKESYDFEKHRTDFRLNSTRQP